MTRWSLTKDRGMREQRIYRAAFCLCLNFVMFSSAAVAQSSASDAYKQIASSDSFAVGGTGITGAVSPSEKSVWVLIRAKDRKQLVALTKDKNPVARLYGLLGLRYLNAPEYGSALGDLTHAKGNVKTLSGCIGGMGTTSGIAAQIAKGEYDKTLKYDLEHRQKK